MKQEYGLGNLLRDKEQARRMVIEAIYYYNCRRPHQALGYKMPEQVHKIA